jgi:hypothetical protein
MGWLIAVIVLIAIIYFLIVSPGFRYVAIILVCLAGFAIYSLIENNKKENEARRQASVAVERAATTAIAISDISLSAVDLTKQQTWWTLKGNVVNNSKYTISSILFLVLVQDCSTQKECVTIGQESARASVSVPAGQMRAFSTYALEFKNMPTVPNPKWRYQVTEIRAAAF